jgi:Ca2+-binding EF-hand superfamily protein
MQKYMLVLTSSAALLVGSALAVSAQQNDTPSMREQLAQAENSPGGDDEPEGMMHRRMMQCHMMGHRGMMGGAAMRIIFALMDSDGDGTVSLQEFQAAHERIFKAMDIDKDGTLTLEEIQHFMHGGPKPAPQR